VNRILTPVLSLLLIFEKTPIQVGLGVALFFLWLIKL